MAEDEEHEETGGGREQEDDGSLDDHASYTRALSTPQLEHSLLNGGPGTGMRGPHYSNWYIEARATY